MYKPFEISELLARIRVLLRRRNSLTSQILQWEQLRLDSNTHEVTYKEQLITLTPKEYRLLELFLRSGDRVLTREIILNRLWDVEEAPSENTISAHIKDLRRKLKQAGADSNLIETVYGVGYRLKPLTIEESNEQEVKRQKSEEENKQGKLRQKTNQALAGVWQKFEGAHHDRLAILERANRAWQNETINNELLQQARYTAHKLAGGLGIFGFTQGSRLALKIEELLIELKEDDIHLSASPRDRAKKFSELLAALKSSLKPNLEPQSNLVKQNRPIILAIDNRAELVQQLTTEMTALGMITKQVAKLVSLKKTLVKSNLDAIIWTFSLADCTVEALNDLARVFLDKLPLPVILFTDNNVQDDLLKISHVCHQILLHKATLSDRTVKTIAKALQQARNKTEKILVVDDDPQALEAIQNLLNPLEIELTTLKDPLKFWQAIAELEPDLLILDVAMPHYTGIELCQLVRSDSRWRELPILFFTIHYDLSTIHKILTAGANDCISKTHASSELIPKIFTHLDRSQLLTTADKCLTTTKSIR